MTVEEWKRLRKGMRVVDRHHGSVIRTIIAISRVTSRNGRGLTRTALTMTSLKSRNGHTIVFASENTGPPRFDMAVTIRTDEHDGTSCSCCEPKR